MPEGKAHEEIVIIVERDGENSICIRKNGHIEYYELRKLTWAGHVEMLGANKITAK